MTDNRSHRHSTNVSFHKSLIKKSLTFAIALATSSLTYGADGSNPQTETLEQVEVEGHPEHPTKRAGAVADLLRDPGIDFYRSGGVASLPVLRGMNDDRVKVLLDGAETTSACANHMNPSLSYLDASQVVAIDTLAGITPVSMGGDSIAGTIVIDATQTHYASDSGNLETGAELGYYYSTNTRGDGITAKAHLANETFSVAYNGAYDKAESYRDGNGDKVLDTLYKSENHSLILGYRQQDTELTLKLGHQEIPYQGFPNQYMDMTDNTSDSVNLRLRTQATWGTFDARVFWQGVDHEMGFFTDEKPGTMPMLTEGEDLGYKLKAEIPVTDSGRLTLGQEIHRFTLDDYWPAVEGSMMMGPNDYININDGERTRYSLYSEWEQELNSYWQIQAGIRYEHVVTDTGTVQPYTTSEMSMGGGMSMGGMDMSTSNVAAAETFNNRDRKRRDDNIDITLQARYQMSDRASLELGYGRKSRSPNLYERYSWGVSTMAMTMVGWYGDANAYVGDMDLNPEIAHTLNATVSLNSEQEGDWKLSLTPYYTYVDDFIDATQIGTFNPRNSASLTRPRLQFANVDAEFYGVDMSGERRLVEHQEFGQLSLSSSLSYTRAKRKNGSDLYQISPLKLDLTLNHHWNNLHSDLQIAWTDTKDHVDPIRMEPETNSYTLVNLHSTLAMGPLSLSIGIENLLDKDYEEPLGGVYYAGWLDAGADGAFSALPGMGRQATLGAVYRF